MTLNHICNGFCHLVLLPLPIRQQKTMSIYTITISWDIFSVTAAQLVAVLKQSALLLLYTVCLNNNSCIFILPVCVALWFP